MHHDLPARSTQLVTLTYCYSSPIQLLSIHSYPILPKSILSRTVLPNIKQVFQMRLTVCSPQPVGWLYLDYKITALPTHSMTGIRWCGLVEEMCHRGQALRFQKPMPNSESLSNCCLRIQTQNSQLPSLLTCCHAPCHEDNEPNL